MNLYKVTFNIKGKKDFAYVVAESEEVAIIIAGENKFIGEDIDDVEILGEDILVQEFYDEG